MSFTLEIKESLREISGILHQINEVVITHDNGMFSHWSSPSYITISDSNNNVTSFLTTLSANQKMLIGYFTTDAFTSLASSVDIDFSDGRSVHDTITSVNISATKIPLPSADASIGAPLANNAWLDTL